jgi:Zn finger protein HypA/HybF involved in hydrogenase expression
MHLSNTIWWKFDPKLTSEADLVKCPECQASSPIKDWEGGSVYCELCGDHDAIVCPNCDESFDHVWGPTFEVTRKAE